jgi:hypothetical protein
VTFTLGDVLVLFILCGVSGYVYQSIRVRELALAAARRACRDAGVQLLDQTVSMQRLSASRDSEQRWRLWRQYRFEYSANGYERHSGNIIMLGKRLQAVVMADRPEQGGDRLH